MAANPQLPSEPPERDPVVEGKRFPWGLVAAILVIIALGLLAFYFFR